MRRVLPLALALALGGCAYYNGMYNTKQLAGRAERAEREGRTLEASGYWSQVVARAESVLVRHPRAGFADEARLLLGTGLVRTGNCSRAVRPLETVMWSSRDPALADRAARLAGDCHSGLGDPAAALAAYNRLSQSEASTTRDFGRYAAGRALGQLGRFEEAVAELAASSHPRADGERAAALAGAGRVPEAVTLADSLLARGDTLVPWDSLLARVRRSDPEAASRLVTRGAADTTWSAWGRGLLLIGDGEFWYPRDSARGGRRFLEAKALGESAPVGRQAELRAAITRLRLATEPGPFRVEAQQVSDYAEVGGALAAEAQRLGTTALRIAAAVDSIIPGAPNGDLRLFLVAETARDSLDARPFAVRQFRRIPEGWPESPYVAKALVALMALEPEAADSLRAELETRYSASPYVLTLLGTETPAFAALEDSLRRFAVRGRAGAVPPAGRPVPPRPQPNQPTTPRAPVD